MSQIELLDDGVLIAASTPFLVFEMPGEPRHKGRPRVRIVRPKGGQQSFAQFYGDPETVAYETALKQLGAILMRGRQPTEEPLSVLLHVFKSIPKSWTLRDREAALSGRLVPTAKPDADNYLKILDALNGVVFADDAQIVDARCIKRYSDKPALRVEIREMIPRI